MNDVAYRTADVDGLTVFYREAGAADAPTLVLLHGFPSASHMFRELIPLLADRFHLVAPDLPGFGKSDMPARDDFHYTFGHIADVIDRLTEVPPGQYVTGGIRRADSAHSADAPAVPTVRARGPREPDACRRALPEVGCLPRCLT
jgi:alpha-beta hydrolase superfamily lysophospholipase